MQIDSDVAQVIARAECEGVMLRITENLERRLRARVTQALTAAGGKWDKTHAAYVFDRYAVAVVEELTTVLKVYRTPEEMMAATSKAFGWDQK